MEIKEKLWTRNFINVSVSNFLIACSFFLLMPTIPVYLAEQLRVPHSQIGIVLSSYAIALLIIRPFSGYLVDIYSRKPLYIIGIAFFTLIFTGYFFAYTVIFFVILRFVHGLFWGLSTVSANTIAIDIIPASRRAEGIGFFGVNTNIAMAVAPYFAVNIYDSYGFPVLISTAILMGSLAVGTALLLKTPTKKRSLKVPPISFDRFVLVNAFPILINQLFLAFGWGTLVAFAVLYGKEIDISNAGIFFLFLASGIILSRVTSGKIVDKGYIHIVMMVAIVTISVGFTCFAMLHNIFAYASSAFVLGIGYGTLFPALQTIYIDMAPASRRGTANSTYLLGFDLGIGIGMLLGAILEVRYGFQSMYLMTAGFCILSLIMYWTVSRKIFERYKLEKD
ncbi:MAG TPA: MFS transporter [Saprospiraceae bacterium]|nr:MFS transporter [Candidatus Parvibacillus calidus]MBX2936403.1 MFS transporter [Saprospiraceae bacterium]MCB0592086.1 MFS transporter [Saprospiraceae bacterium]MCO5283102.1 MFS transporter [Saprospiraceae bacterium]MCO6469816.1 MFS transporter [Saprospiraceae bacterium]